MGILTSKDARVYYKKVERKKLFRGIRRRVCAVALGERGEGRREEKQAGGEWARKGTYWEQSRAEQDTGCAWAWAAVVSLEGCMRDSTDHHWRAVDQVV